MSVAFRRDSDEEHLEPKFELPIPPGPNRVTERGLALIGETIAALEAQLAQARQRAAQEPVATTPAMPEGSEMAALRRDLRYWQTRQITAELMPIPTGDTVEFGTEVQVRLNGKLRTFQIVGDDEADPAAGRLSHTAPLSRALLGAEVGEVLAFGGAEDAIEVVGINQVVTLQCD